MTGEEIVPEGYAERRAMEGAMPETTNDSSEGLTVLSVPDNEVALYTSLALDIAREKQKAKGNASSQVETNPAPVVTASASTSANPDLTTFIELIEKSRSADQAFLTRLQALAADPTTASLKHQALVEEFSNCLMPTT